MKKHDAGRLVCGAAAIDWFAARSAVVGLVATSRALAAQVRATARTCGRSLGPAPGLHLGTL